MFFRRELDFDELIETIDQLADEEIDEVVDWQMTESPAAKTEGIKSRERQAIAATEIGRRLANRAIEYGGQLAGIAAQPLIQGTLSPRNRAARAGDQLTRTELRPGRGEFVIPNLPEITSFNPAADPARTLDLTYQRISYDVETMLDPMRDILHIRLSWSTDGQRFQYQQVGVSRQMLESAPSGIELMRSEEITPGRTIAVYLDPGARNRQYPIRTFMETEERR